MIFSANRNTNRNFTTRVSHIHLFTRGVVDRELQCDDDVVLHAADLAVERDARLAEVVGGLLELQGVDVHLLAEARGVLGGALGKELRQNAHASFAQHVVKEGAHGVLDLLGGEDAVALGRVVHAVAGPGKAL